MPNARVLSEGIYFGEGPRWRPDADADADADADGPAGGRFWFSDFFAHAVCSVGLAGDVRVEVRHDGRPSGLGWLPDGRLLFVSMEDRRLMRVEADGSVVEHADLSAVATFHTNDLLVDADGRAYVGNFGFDLDDFIARHGVAALRAEPGPPTACVAVVGTDGSVGVAADGLSFPNGMVLTPDGSTFIVSESMAGRMRAYDRDAQGLLSSPRVWADFVASDRRVTPDGCCLDAEGAIWVANAAAPEVLRVREGGEVIDRVDTSQLAFACMLGGPEGRDLLICTAPAADASRAALSPKGRLELATVDVAHAGRP